MQPALSIAGGVSILLFNCHGVDKVKIGVSGGAIAMFCFVVVRLFDLILSAVSLFFLFWVRHCAGNGLT